MILYDKVTWVDVNTNYGADSDPELLVDAAAINNSLMNIFTCMVGTRANQRDYGSYLMQQLFEPCDNVTADDVMFGLIQSVEKWEPRIFINRAKTSVYPLPTYDGFDVNFGYFIKKIQRPASYRFTAQRITQD